MRHEQKTTRKHDEPQTLTVGNFWVPGNAVLVDKPDPHAPQHPRLSGVGLVRLDGVPELQELQHVGHVLHRRRWTFHAHEHKETGVRYNNVGASRVVATYRCEQPALSVVPILASWRRRAIRFELAATDKRAI